MIIISGWFCAERQLNGPRNKKIDDYEQGLTMKAAKIQLFKDSVNTYKKKSD